MRPRSLSLSFSLSWWVGEKASVSPPFPAPGCHWPGGAGAWVQLASSGCVPLLQTPTLIVYGDQDVELGQTSLNNLQHLPKHQVLMLQGAGHPCYLDKPAEWHHGLLAFLQQLE